MPLSGSKTRASSWSIVPVRNSMLEMWPSPTPRALITNRVEPAGRPSWSGWGTIDGLNSAAASIAYSWLNYSPPAHRRVFQPGVRDRGCGTVQPIDGAPPGPGRSARRLHPVRDERPRGGRRPHLEHRVPHRDDRPGRCPRLRSTQWHDDAAPDDPDDLLPGGLRPTVC